MQYSSDYLCVVNLSIATPEGKERDRRRATIREKEWNDVHIVYKGMVRSLYMHWEDSLSTCTGRIVSLHALGGWALYMHWEDGRSTCTGRIVSLHAPGG